MKFTSSKIISLTLLLSFILLSTCGISQTQGYVIRGKVLDKNSRQPLQGASVFAQNTTQGTATNSDGEFRLYLPNGGYNIAITFTGYETENIRVNQSTPSRDSLLVELSPEMKSMEEVSIAFSNEVKDGWQKYGAFFTENFIGQSKFASECVIKNPEVLRFYFSKKKNQLKVVTREPLVVDNFALGYTIKFAIDSFINNYNTNTNLFIGQPLFVEMEGTDEQLQKWDENREIAYNGSMLHFMRSLYQRTLKEEGFELQFIVKNKEEEMPIQIPNLYGALNYSKDDSTNVVEFRPNQLEIALIYNKEKPELAYTKLDSTAKKKFQLSTLTFAKGEYVVIEQNGYYYDQEDIITNGYLAFKKVGDMLPYDYLLEVEEEIQN
ncbi:MAG: carboxypeptidase-like regulatory domain-containing protein [Ginsengibacter sp.]